MPRWNPAADADLQAGPSSLPDAGSGLFAAADLPAKSVLPPYKGKLLTVAEAKHGGSYVWCPRDVGPRISSMTWKQAERGKNSRDISFCVDAEHAVKDNPSRLVNAAATDEQKLQVNVEICEIGKVMYYRTTQDVQCGQELITDYGGAYTFDD